MDWAVLFQVVLQAILDAINDKGAEKTRRCLRRGGGRLDVLRAIKDEIGDEAFRANRREISRVVLDRLSDSNVDFLMAQAQAAD
jgi:hypothetical protein